MTHGPIPVRMRAARVSTPGAADVLGIGEIDVPAPGEADVLIRVEAAGINRPDVLQRMGHYPPPPGAPDTLGLEVAGEVVACGTKAQPWTVGDRVCALVAGGGYAEYCVAPAVQCLPVPAGMSWVEAAAVPETTFTVWHNVFERGQLKAGEWLLVHGGSSGIGTTAIQMAHARGARVIVTVGNDEKARVCRELGAERAVNYRTEDFVAVAAELTGKAGVDVILDMVGGEYFPRNLEALAIGGRLVVIAFLRGTKAQVDLTQILRRRLTVTGSALRTRSIADKGLMAEALEREIWPLLESRRIRPIVHATFPLEQAAQAHRLMESSEHIGKIVLTVGPDAQARS